jgi:hypothetical protein
MVQEILSYFPIKNLIIETDNFSNYELKYLASIDVERIKLFDQIVYDKFNSIIVSYGYDWSFELEENNYSINQSNFEEIQDYEDLDDVTLTLQIFKRGKNIYIFKNDLFLNTVEILGLEGVLKTFKESFKEGIVLFIDGDSSQKKLSSNYIGYNLDLKETLEKEIVLSNQCNFNNFSDFKFSPCCFNIGDFSSGDKIIELISKIYQVFILIYIFDRSEIVKDTLKLKISGYKTLEYNLTFKNLNIDSLSIYEKIFEWIYSEKSKVEDKIGITRNILSIYLKEDEIVIDENTFNSILSANNTYIKGNISKYIETRAKIHEQIEQISNKINSSLEVFYNNFQKSIFVFISFYLTIFILKFYTKTDPTTSISKEATIMAIGLLSLSALFLFFSIWVLYLEKKRIKTKYDNVKSRATDLLLEEDINKILDNDREYKDEIVFLDKRRNLYIILWGATLVTFIIILFTTSDYINFKYLWR